MLSGVLLRPLLPIDETRYVSVAWEMWLSGDYFVPTKNFELYSHKPPLLFWLINLSWGLTGVTEFAARLIGPAFGVGTVALTGMLARRLWPNDQGVGHRTMLALSGMTLFAVFAGLTMFDALLAACVVAAMLALLNAARTGNAWWWVVLGCCLGAGILAKGPVMLLHVVPVALAMPFWFRPNEGARPLSLRRSVGGTGLALLVTLAVISLWLVPALMRGGPDYREAILWGQTAGRITQSFAHAQPWWFYTVCLPAFLFPWFWMPSLWKTARFEDWRETGLRLALVWSGSALVLFSFISGKQIYYLLPEMPALALIAGRLLRQPKTRKWAPAIMGVVPIVVANLVFGVTELRSIHSAEPIAEVIAPAEDDGIAFLGNYHAQFNFAGRLKRPVAEVHGTEELAQWMNTHPGGLLVGKLNRGPDDWAPQTTIDFRGSPYGIWAVSDAPKADAQP